MLNFSKDSASNEPIDARLLIVGGGAFQLDMIRTAKRLVRETWVVDRDPAAPGMALADRAVAIDFGYPEQVVAFARRTGFQGITTAASDAAVPAVSACVEALGLNGIDKATARRCRDKLETKRTLELKGLRAPLTRLVSDIAAAKREASMVGGYPLVVKPRFGAGGRGVSLVKSENDLEAAVRKVQRYVLPGDGFLLQQWISGHSVGVEAFLWKGELVKAFCLSDQYIEGFISPVGHGLPSDLDHCEQARIIDAVEAFCQALELGTGPFNFDLRDTPDGVCLIEINPRLGGNSITQLVRASYRIDLAEITVRTALGQNPAESFQSQVVPVPCASRLIAVYGAGSRAVIRNPSEDLLADDDLLELEVVTYKGETAALRVDDWALLGRCLVKAESTEAAIAFARRIVEEIQSRVTLAPPPR